MNADFDDLKSLWQESRQDEMTPPGNVDVLLGMARKKMKSTIHLQWSTIIILFATLLIIGAFFKYVAQFRQTASLVGMWLMMGGLMVRIALELISIYLSQKINLTGTALEANNKALGYVRFRKTMNGPVTILIVLFYSIGFYMLTPEFSLYFNTTLLLLINASYLLAAVIFIWSIRKAVKKETELLREMMEIREEIMGKFPHQVIL